MVGIQEFAKRLAAVPQEQFTHERVLDFLRENIVDPASLGPYLWISGDHYTRNLIAKTPLYELIAICWDIGQKSPIHNHRDQNCWMAVPHGKLHVHNFRLVKKDASKRFCELQSTGQVILDSQHPAEVDPAEPIHEVVNMHNFNCRAVSLHIYSLPFDTCEIYDLKTKTYQDVPMVNTTVFGELQPTEWKVERFTL